MPAERLAELVERQRGRWAIDRGAGMPQPRGPAVAISRLAASGGEDLAQRVAAWLDYGLFGAEELGHLAADRGWCERLMADLDDSARAAAEARVRQVLAASTRGDDAEWSALVRVVVTLGERGMAVLLGRGAASILASARALRVLVVAPFATRLERYAARHGLEAGAAGEALAREDAEWTAFVRSRLGTELTDPTGYDLVVNTERLDLEAAAALVVEALRRRFAATPSRP